MAGRYFITDVKPATFKFENGEEIKLSRYGVWDTVGRKPHVIDQNDDLEMLMKKYDVSKIDVFVISPGKMEPLE